MGALGGNDDVGAPECRRRLIVQLLSFDVASGACADGVVLFRQPAPQTRCDIGRVASA